MHTLRFIDSKAMPGPLNMAIDEALANSLSQRRDFAYLRFYQWQPPTLSFGYNQKIDRLIDIDMTRKEGFGIVKRMSGGKMVFHNLELTFSLGLTSEQIAAHLGKGATFIDMFKFAIEPMVSALVMSGIPARFSSAREMRHTSQNSLHCYAAAAGHSIFAGDKKLIGAAGIFRGNCLVIHGSIPIEVTFPPHLIFKNALKPESGVNMAALSEFINSDQIARLPDNMGQTYARLLNLQFTPGGLLREEAEAANLLAQNKYADPFWTAGCEIITD